ncbi:hypothetical protein F2P45_05835 [Massilia sp. CCM 8733]|uniref:Transmembrane protein n=1 Tax=Massilia mucilaginosa TaxID=2609282 RepID=A0ABX0NP48_9BURK|nr:hypothetical protein [Massilia mucilaginosa]NHZ88545.1 hypothetical protein [Massilia mucilaginosa]
MMASENFEQVLAAAQAGESLHPAWKKLVRTQFFVAVLAPADGDAGYTLHLPQGARAILMSEVRERLADAEGSLLVALPGADVVRMVPHGVGLAVTLSEQVFEIAASRVAWIGKSIEATLLKAAQARAAATPPAAPDPASASDPTPAAAAPYAPAAPQKTAPAAGRLPVLEPMPAGAYEDLVFVDEDPPPPTVPLLDRIGRKRALAYGLPLLAAAGLAGQALMRAMAERPRSAQAFGGSGDGATRDAGPAGAARKGGAPLASQVWTSPDGALTIEFPGKPDEDAVRANMLERMGAVRMRQFSASAHSESYRLQVLDLGTAPDDPEAAMLKLQATLLGHNDVLTVPPMELIFKGYPGRDIKAGQRLIRMVVVGSTAYIATADADAAPASMARAGAFIGSLALTQ